MRLGVVWGIDIAGNFFPIADILEGLVLLATFLGVLVAVQAIRGQTQNSRIEKIADILIECARRYEALIDLRHQLETSVQKKEISRPKAAERYFYAYWNLQWDQWVFYRLGLLPIRILALWFLERIGTLKTNPMIFGVSFENGWKTFGKQFTSTYPDFAAFVDEVWAMKEMEESTVLTRITQLLDKNFDDFKATRRAVIRKSITR